MASSSGSDAPEREMTESRFEKAVDARRFVGIVAIQLALRGAAPGNGAKNAVRFEDADGTVRTECRRHGAKRLRLQKRVGLEQLAGESTPPLASVAAVWHALVGGEFTRGEIPQPVTQTGGPVTDDIDGYAAQTGCDQRLPHAWIRQVGKDPQYSGSWLGHGGVATVRGRTASLAASLRRLPCIGLAVSATA